MSTVLQKTSPKNIQRLTAVNTFIISQNLSSDGNVLAAGDYKITNDIDETKQSMNVTSSYTDHHQNNSLNIIDEKGNIILECNQVQRTCLRNVFNIYSPAGFKLGSLRKRLFRCKTEYEISSGSRNLLFLLKIDKKPSGFRINITNIDEINVVATIDLLTRQIDKIQFTLTYLENIAILQKTLIMCAAISCCEQEYKPKTSDICSRFEESFCYTLFERSKVKFAILSVLFPLLVGIYFVGILMVVSMGVWLFLLICFPCLREKFKLVFTWPCVLCGLCEIDMMKL